MKVPFLDLKIQYESLRGEIASAIQDVMDQTAFAGGPFVEKFEKEFAAFCKCHSSIAVGSGTDALWVALLMLGVGPGDEVITVPNTFIATAEAITFVGATPVFVDVDEKTYTMNVKQLESAVTAKTKAIIPVHLYGQMADMDPIMEIALAKKLFVIEDACQAHGAEYKGRRAGSIGHAGCFSFYPGKNLGAYGEGGAITTNDEKLAEKMRVFRDHGQAKKYYHSIVGWNARMDGIQGAILSVKLRYLEKWNQARRENAALYDQLLENVPGLVRPFKADYTHHVYHIYCVRVKERDELIKTLASKNIACGIHYPVPLHLQEAYKSMGLDKGSFPVAEKCAEQIVSLPMFAELTSQQIKAVCEELQSFVQR